jgi:hypothetical protein
MIPGAPRHRAMLSLHLAIGGLPLRLSTPSASLHAALGERYHHFLQPAAPGAPPPALTVHLLPDPAAPPRHHPTPACTFHGADIHFDLPGYRGVIPQAGAARLTFNAPQPDTAADYFLRACLAALAERAGGLLLHACGIVRGGQAFLFFGPSGSGKTTVARRAPAGCTVLNDDLTLLLPDPAGWRACGTPFTNPTQVPPANASAPAAALLRLAHSPANRLEPLPPARAPAELLASIPVLNAAPAPPLTRCQHILADLPARTLHLRPDPSFWELLDEPA